MNVRKIMFGIAGTLLAVMVAMILLAPPAAATNDPPAGGGIVTGDWTVTDYRSYNTTTITINNGNIVVSATGTLVFNHTTLRFNPNADGTYALTVKVGGTFTTGNQTIITSISGNHYKFIVNGAMDMNNSQVSQMWGSSTSWEGGIQCYSDSISIANSTITYGKTGGISIFNCSPVINKNNVMYNGQDGNSGWYAYGIYCFNTKSNITNNYIAYNQFAVPQGGYAAYKWPDGWGDDYWNGNWYYYYYYYGAYYRELQEYIIDASIYTGKGVYIEGGSNARLSGNTIERNGWAQGYQNYNYMGQLWEDGSHVIGYWYQNQYGIPNCDGIGIYGGNSTFEVTGNTVDKNGFDTQSTAYQIYTGSGYVVFYSNMTGIGVKMFNSNGNITNNKITNAATNLQCLQSSNARIENNTITTDYGQGQWGGDVSSAFNPERVGRGIQVDRSSAYIYNNTVLLQMNDWDIWTGNDYIFFADSVVALDISLSPNALVENNRFTVESRQGGGVPGICINVTMKSSVKLYNNTCEFKSQNNWGYYPTHRIIQVAFASSASISNCTLKMPSVVQGGGQPVIQCIGISAFYGSTVTLYDMKLTAGTTGLLVRDFSSVDANLTNVTNAASVCIIVERSSVLNMVNCRVSGPMRGLQASGSKVTYTDCNLSTGQEFQLNKAANVELFNTTHTRGSMQLLDTESWLNVSWPVRMTVAWQNHIPVDKAGISIKDMMGAQVYSGTTGPDGTVGKPIWVKEYQAHSGVVSKLTPHRITAEKGRALTMELYMVNGPIEFEFILVDNIPPDLTITSPADGALVANSSVTIKGAATDPEAGLLDDTVLINIDNQGWTPLTVTNGFWAISKIIGEGNHIVRVRAEDLVGNSALRTISFTVDTIAPGLTIFSPVEGCYTNQRTITVSGLTEVGALVNVNGAKAEMEGRYFKAQLSLEDGPNTITVTASDRSGNTRMVEIHLTLDTVPPILEITSPARGSSTNQNPISVIGTTEPTAKVTINGYAAPLVGTEFEALVELSEGANTLTVIAVDLAGNVNTLSYTVYLDTVIPDLTIFTPRDELWTRVARVLVSGATETGATVTINGQSTNVANTGFQMYIGLSEGANKIDILARDAAGNRELITRTVYQDTRLPDLIVTSPMDRSSLATRVVTVSGSVDWGSEVRVNGERVPVMDFVFTTTVAFTDDGQQTIEVTATDLAGNIATITRAVSIDTTPPAVTINFPDNDFRTKMRTITVTGQTEPYATVVINTETVVVVGKDGLFSVPVVLEDGKNRVTVKSTDAAGNTATGSVEINKVKPVVAPKSDMSWALNMSGLMIGIGLAIPIAAALLAESWRRRRGGVLAELEAEDAARKEREARRAAKAARPTVERFEPKPAEEKPVEAPAPVVMSAPVEEAKPEPPQMAELPKPEETPGAPAAPKTGLIAKAGSTEVAPDDTDQNTRLFGKRPAAPETSAPARVEENKGMKDKGTEVEEAAGETEIPSAAPKKRKLF